MRCDVLAAAVVAAACVARQAPAAVPVQAGAYNSTLTFENLCATCGDDHKCGEGALLLLEEERPGNCKPLLELSPTRVATGPNGCWAVHGECTDGAAIVVAPCSSPAASFRFDSSSQTVISGHCKGWCGAKAGGPPASPAIVLGNCSSTSAQGWTSLARSSVWLGQGDSGVIDTRCNQSNQFLSTGNFLEARAAESTPTSPVSAYIPTRLCAVVFCEASAGRQCPCVAGRWIVHDDVVQIRSVGAGAPGR